MTPERKAEIIEEVEHIRQAGHDPANMARKRLLQICDELLGIEHVPETHEQWKQRMARMQAEAMMGSGPRRG